MNSLKPPLNLLRATILISTFISSGTLFSSPQKDRAHLGTKAPSTPTQHLMYATSSQNPLPFSDDLERTPNTWSHHIKENTATLTGIAAIPIGARLHLHPPMQRLSHWILKKLPPATLHTLIGGGALLGGWLYKTKKNHLLPTHSHPIHSQNQEVVLSSEEIIPSSQKTTSEHTHPFSPPTPEPENKTPTTLLHPEDTGEEAPILEAHNGYMNQEIQKEIAHLKTLYYQLPDEQWYKRVAPYVGSQVSRKKLESKIISDIYELFEQERNRNVKNRYSPLSRGLRAQYIFLSYMMKLEKITQKELALKLKSNSETNISIIYNKLKRHLVTYQKKPHTQSLNNDDHNQRWSKLKVDFFKLNKDDLKIYLKDIVADETLEHINPHNLMNYLQRTFKEEAIDIFFGLFLKIRTLNAREYSELYNKNKDFAYHQKYIILKKLSRLTPKELIPHPQNSEELLQALWLHWEKVIFSDQKNLKNIRQRFHLSTQEIHPFLSAMEQITTEYEYIDQKNIKLKKYLLLNEVTDRYYYTMKELADLFQVSKSTVVHTRSIIRNDINDYLDTVPLFFQNIHDLYLHQRNMILRLDREETYRFSASPRIRNQPRMRFKRDLNTFLEEKGIQKDLTSVILFYASLGIPKISLNHLAHVLQKNPLEIQEKMNQLHELWLRDHLIKTVHPINYDDLVDYFNNLTNSQWTHLKKRWGLSSLGVNQFKIKVYKFFKKHDYFRRHIFLSSILKLEVTSKNLFNKIFTNHQPLKKPLDYLLSKDMVDSIQNTKTDLIIQFESQLFDQPNDNSHPKTSFTSYEELHQATKNAYINLSDAQIRTLSHTWGFYSEEDILIFKSKLRSFAHYLIKEYAKKFDIFISLNLKLISINNKNLSKNIGINLRSMDRLFKDNYLLFDDHLNTEYFLSDKTQILNALDTAIAYHLDQPSNVLLFAAEYGMNLPNSYEALKEDIIHCHHKIIQNSTDRLIFALFILKIGNFTTLDISNLSKRSVFFLHNRKKEIEKKWRSCLPH